MQMKIKSFLPLLAASVVLVPATGIFAQDTGVSHPEKLNDPIDATVQPTPHYVKPSPAVPMAAPSSAYTDRYVPYNPNGTATPSVATPTSSTPTLQTRVGNSGTSEHYVPSNGTPNGGYTQASSHAFVDGDVNSGVVTYVHSAPNELPIGTRIAAILDTPISTKMTQQGSHFTAALANPVMKQGQILLPAGTVISGRITQIHGGRRISGASAIRLQPDSLLLPDHTTYRINAEVTDLDHYKDSHVNGEGTIISNPDKVTTVAAIGLTTGSATVAGAMLGGGVGAVVGAGIGAGIGTIWWLRQDHQQTLPQGTEIVFSLGEPLIVGSPSY
jgi:hypothetical protein